MYCTSGDLLTGNIPTPAYLNKDKFVQDATDEIDSMIGFVYKTPIDVSDDSEVVRPARLLLKRLNVFLATGRLLMAVSSPSENSQLHAYGLSLAQSALKTLEQVVEGKVLILGAEEISPETDLSHRGPMISNVDSESTVEAFYGELVPLNRNDSRVNGSYWLTPEGESVWRRDRSSSND